MPALIWTVSLPEPSRMSPPILGVMLVLALALWTRVTPVLLWLRSMATVLPAGVSVGVPGVSTVPMALVLEMLLSVPDRSTMAAALPVFPVRDPLIVPVLTTAGRLAPASMSRPVAWEAALEVTTAPTMPSLRRSGMVAPASTCRPVALSWKPWPEMVLVEATCMPPSMVTVCPAPPPIWMPVPEWPSNTPDPVTLPSMIRP